MSKDRVVLGVYSALPRWFSSRIVGWVKGRHVIGVVAVVMNPKGEFLLLRHTYHHPRIRLPGGLMERGEGPKHTATREAMEEASCVVKPLLVMDAVSFTYTFDVFVLCSLVEEQPFVKSAEVDERMWLAEGDPRIPEVYRPILKQASTIYPTAVNIKT